MSSGWTLIESEFSSPNFNSSVRAERSFAIHYLNVVIKPLCGNLDIFLTASLTPTSGRGILFACFSYGPRLKVKDAFWIALFGRDFAQFSRFLLNCEICKKPEHANAPFGSHVSQFRFPVGIDIGCCHCCLSRMWVESLQTLEQTYAFLGIVLY